MCLRRASAAYRRAGGERSLACRPRAACPERARKSDSERASDGESERESERERDLHERVGEEPHPRAVAPDWLAHRWFPKLSGTISLLRSRLVQMDSVSPGSNGQRGALSLYVCLCFSLSLPLLPEPCLPQPNTLHSAVTHGPLSVSVPPPPPPRRPLVARRFKFRSCRDV